MPMFVRPVTDERDGLLSFLAHARTALTAASYGLTDAQASLAATPSTLSVGGLIKHVTGAERSWAATIRGQQQMRDAAAYVDSFRFAVTDSFAAVIADYEAAAKETDDLVASIADLAQPVVMPEAPWLPDDVEEWSVRWVLLHLIDETYRHAGHADLIREAIDGATAGQLLAAIEGWPETEFVKPWKPAA